VDHREMTDAFGIEPAYRQHHVCGIHGMDGVPLSDPGRICFQSLAAKANEKTVISDSHPRMRTPVGGWELPSENGNSHRQIGIPIENKKNRRPHRSGSGEPKRTM
jgi:hypothetical protein